MHESSEDDEITHEIEPPRPLPPVQSPDQLPTRGVAEGTLCLVHDEATGRDRLWAFRDGAWSPVL